VPIPCAACGRGAPGTRDTYLAGEEDEVQIELFEFHLSRLPAAGPDDVLAGVFEANLDAKPS